MTIPALIAISLLLGASIAFGARVQIRTLQRHVFGTRYFMALMMVETMVVMPMAAYFHIFYPDWSWMYLVNTAYLNPGVLAMTFITFPLMAAMGYLIGYYSARSASDWVTVMFMAFMGLGLLALFIVARDQLMWVGTYQQYHRDVGLKLITSTSVVPSVVLFATGLAMSTGYTIYRFRREGRTTSQSV